MEKYPPTDDTRISYLVVLAGESVGRVIRLDKGLTMTAGRTRDCDIYCDCDNVSREHACFKVDGNGETELSDLGSTNGTLVNGKEIKTARLKDGDRISMGDMILRFCSKDGLEFDFQQNLYDKATRDPLTGAHNKRFFTETLEQELAFHKRQNQQLSLIIFDLDLFKRLNDTYGHLNGDKVLQAIGHEVGSIMRREDTFARFGGEEFVVLLRATPHQQALAVAEKIRTCIAALTFNSNGETFSSTATLGVATYENDNYASSEALIMAADNNLFIGKGRGRNTVIG